MEKALPTHIHHFITPAEESHYVPMESIGCQREAKSILIFCDMQTLLVLNMDKGWKWSHIQNFFKNLLFGFQIGCLRLSCKVVLPSMILLNQD